MAHRIRGVILDVDGTLVNSNDAHARAWQAALSEAGISADFNAIRRLIGTGGDRLLPAIAGIESSSPLGERISERRAELFRTQHLPQLRAFPKTRELLQRMRDDGLRLVVASSAQKAEAIALLELAHVGDLIDHATTAGDITSSKPAPDGIEAALTALQLSPDRALMLGDTPYDVEAAARAGTATVALRSGGRSDSDLAAALAIYDDCADLLERFASSPFRPSRASP